MVMVMMIMTTVMTMVVMTLVITEVIMVYYDDVYVIYLLIGSTLSGCLQMTND